MKKWFTLFVLLLFLKNAEAQRKDSIMNPAMHFSIHAILGSGVNLNAYFVNNRWIMGAAASFVSLERANRDLANKPFDYFEFYGAISGFDIRVDKYLSFSLIGKFGYMKYTRAENIRIVDQGSFLTYQFPPRYEYEKSEHDLLAGKVNLSMNLHLSRTFAVQFGMNQDIHKFKGKPGIIAGLKLNFGF